MKILYYIGLVGLIISGLYLLINIPALIGGSFAPVVYFPIMAIPSVVLILIPLLFQRSTSNQAPVQFSRKLKWGMIILIVIVVPLVILFSMAQGGYFGNL